MIKYGDMITLRNKQTGEIKEIPSSKLYEVSPDQNVTKVAELPEWEVVHEEDSRIRTERSDG
jgi:DNA helicase TIP49 (TBP-interacting protein)